MTHFSFNQLFVHITMYLAMETPFRLRVQLRRPNQGYAVDNLTSNFTFYMPRKHSLYNPRIHKRSCTFPSIKKNAPLRQILLQDHYSGEMPFVYSIEGKKIIREFHRGTPEESANNHRRTLLSMFNLTI